MASRFVNPTDPFGQSAVWNPASGFTNPFTNQPLNSPTDAQGNSLNAVWNPGLGDYILPNGAALHAPRIASTGPAGGFPGAFGGIGGSVGGAPSGGLPGVSGTAGSTSTGAGGTNPYFTISNPKSAPINAANSSLLTGLNKTIGTGVSDYTDYLKSLFPTMEANTGQEIGKINSLYNGGQAATSAGQLADLRAATDRMEKLNQDRALSYSKGADAASGASAPRPFTSSATQREFLRATNEANTPLELNYADRNRSYQQADLANALAAIGQANAQRNNLAKQKLLPVQAEQANLQTNAGILAPISATDLAQNFYGLGGDASQIGGNQFFVPNYGSPPASGGFPAIPGVAASRTTGGVPNVYRQSGQPGAINPVTGQPSVDWGTLTDAQIAQIQALPAGLQQQAANQALNAQAQAAQPWAYQTPYAYPPSSDGLYAGPMNGQG